MTLTDAGTSLALRQTVGQLLGIVAGFAIQTIALCAALGMILMRWPQLHGASQGIAIGCVGCLGWQLLSGRVARAAAIEPVPFCEAAARQLLNSRSWMVSAAAAMLCLPLTLEPVLMAGYTGAI